MLKRRPPLTTLETRLTWTTVSSRFSFEASILGILLLAALKFQAYFTSAFCKSGHSSMIGIATTVKDNTTDILFFRTLGNKFTHLTSSGYFSIMCNWRECLNWRFLLASYCLWQQRFDLCAGFSTFTNRSTLGWSFLGLRRFALTTRCSLSSHCNRFSFFSRTGCTRRLLLGRSGWLKIAQAFVK